ncbi:MAG TPA: hypothetical protein VME20_09365 [Acidimicrobiales bacterium]|nr:hypothetical protein [Acidimicrobiales bacterium]
MRADLAARTSEGILTCSDRRLRTTLDRLYNDGRRVIVSTPGANVGAVSKTLEDLIGQGTKRWVVLSHTDSVDRSNGCGWAARLEMELAAGQDRSTVHARYIGAATLEKFAQLGCTTRADIEGANAAVQAAALQEILAGSGGRAERSLTLDTAYIVTDQLMAPGLVVTLPSVVKYSSLTGRLNANGGSSLEPDNTYYLQVCHLEEALAGARLLVGAVGIKDVRLVALSEKDNELMAHWASRFQTETFMKAVGLTYLKWQGMPA